MSRSSGALSLQIRNAIRKDYADFASFWPALGDPITPPPLRQRWEKEMMPTSLVAVAVDDDGDDDVNNSNQKVVGYVWWTATATATGVSPALSLPEGQIKCIMVDASCRRRGVATALLRAVAQKLREEKGCRRWRLHVRPENQGAVALYRKFGLERRCGAAEVHLTWDCVSRMSLRPAAAVEEGPTAINNRSSLECRLVGPPEEETEIETAFGLCPGVFGEARQFGGRIPLQLRRSSDGTTKTKNANNGNERQLLGCCIFDPKFPGAYPFCVTRPAYARTLLEEMQKHRDKARDDFFLLVENDEALTDALVAAGAKVEIRLDCYSGSLGWMIIDS